MSKSKPVASLLMTEGGRLSLILDLFQGLWELEFPAELSVKVPDDRDKL